MTEEISNLSAGDVTTPKEIDSRTNNSESAVSGSEPVQVITVVDWNKHYENNRTRELKRMAWVPMPNRHDGDGYTELLSHENGAAHFGAWCALIEVASRCEVRGTLLRDGGKPHDAESLERMTRVPVKVWKETLPRLVSIGWIKITEISAQSRTAMRNTADDNGSTSQDGDYGTEGNGKKEGEGREAPAPPLSAPHPEEKENPVIVDLMDIYKKATGMTLLISEDDMPRFLSLLRQYDGPSVVAAYRIHQTEKPGKEMRWFLKDFAEYHTKAQKLKARSEPSPPHVLELHNPTPEEIRESALIAADMKREHKLSLTELEQAAVNYSEGKPLSDHERQLLGLPDPAVEELANAGDMF